MALGSAGSGGGALPTKLCKKRTVEGDKEVTKGLPLYGLREGNLVERGTWRINRQAFTLP